MTWWRRWPPDSAARIAADGHLPDAGRRARGADRPMGDRGQELRRVPDHAPAPDHRLGRTFRGAVPSGQPRPGPPASLAVRASAGPGEKLLPALTPACVESPPTYDS